jgi:tetratricopeptide (TPR) repeat protein/tRNA A-37 threonylcarbamoyl transferase component Bud32
MNASNTAEREGRLGDILAALIEAAESGQALDRVECVARYPEFATELGEFFESEDRLHSLAAPLRAAVAGDTPAPAITAPDGEGLVGLRAGQEVGDYELLEEIGRGGMGVVFKARQKGANRVVALKLLRPDPLGGEEQTRRFRNEAEIVAQLDHPSIVPLYEVGESGAGVWFSMKLIEGGSLAEAIADCRLQIADSQKIAAQLLVQVARAIHHAHQRGVLHRDLKPSNILLDEAGVPYVTDFGLARRLEVDSSLTQSGVLMGTPSYMAPEQASGQRAGVTTATDVHALGAVLYALLTGRPPFQAEDVLQTLMQVQEREPERPGRINRGVARDLETICLKCLHKEPQQRYASALALAEDLERFLAGQPIQARPVGIWERGVKWTRRRPLAVAAVIGLVASLALVIGGVGWVLGERAVRQREAEAKVVESLEEAAPALREGNPYNPALVAAVQRAEAQRATGVLRAELQARVVQLLRDVEMLVRLETARLQGAAGDKETGFDYAGADRHYAEGFEWYGLDLITSDPTDAAECMRKSPIRTQLVAALDDWAFVRDKLRQGTGASPRAVADLADDDPWRKQLRRAMSRGKRGTLEKLAEAKSALSQPSASLELLAVALAEAHSGEAAEVLLRRAQAAHPADFWINFQLAVTIRRNKQPDTGQAVRFYQAALALRPDSPIVFTNLGNALRDQGRLPEAETALRKAIELKPNLPRAHNSLGNVLSDQRKLAEAEAAYRKAIELQSDYALAHINLGTTLYKQGRLVEAETAYRKAIQLKRDYAVEVHTELGMTLLQQRKLPDAVAALRKATELRPDYVRAHLHLGNALKDQGKLAEAETAYRNAIKHKPNFAEAHCNLGNVLSAQERLAEAEGAFRKAIEIKPDLAVAHNSLGALLQKQGRLVDAAAAYRKATEIKSDYALAHSNLSVVLVKLGKLPEAVAACRKAIELKPDFALAHYNLGNALNAQGKAAEAEAAYRKAIELKPDYAEAHCNLGNALRGQGKLAQAEAACRKAIVLNPQLVAAHYNLGMALDAQSKAVDAEAAYRDAIALKPDYAEAHCNLGAALTQQGRFTEALAAWKRGHELGSRRPDWRYPSEQWVRQAEQRVAFDARLAKVLSGEAKPSSVGETIALAQLCQIYKKQYAAAARFFADAFVADPRLSGDRPSRHRHKAARAAALAGCGQGKDAAGLDERERAHLRQQALDWLRADLNAWKGQLTKEPDKTRPLLIKQMQHWQADTDFNGLRGNALARLPADEQRAWQKLWADVADMLARAQKRTTPESKAAKK